jgi:hypothetical protein
MGMGMGGGMGFDAKAAYKAERELLTIHKHTFNGDQAEMDLLGSRYPGMGANSDAGADLLNIAGNLSKYVIE